MTGSTMPAIQQWTAKQDRDNLRLIPPLADEFVVYGGKGTVKRARRWALDCRYVLADGVPSCAHGLYLLASCPGLSTCRNHFRQLDHVNLWVPTPAGDEHRRPFLLFHPYVSEISEGTQRYAEAHGLDVGSFPSSATTGAATARSRSGRRSRRTGPYGRSRPKPPSCSARSRSRGRSTTGRTPSRERPQQPCREGCQAHGTAGPPRRGCGRDEQGTHCRGCPPGRVRCDRRRRVRDVPPVRPCWRPGASVATGRPYMWQAGELLVGTGDVNEDGELHFHYKPAASGYNGLEFHCWITERPEGELGTAVTGGPEVEYADFALRHVMRAVELSGMPWRRERLPAYYWGSYVGLTSLRVFSKADPQMMALIASRDADADLIGKTAALAVRRLGLPSSRFHDWLEVADTVS